MNTGRNESRPHGICPLKGIPGASRACGCIADCESGKGAILATLSLLLQLIGDLYLRTELPSYLGELRLQSSNRILQWFDSVDFQL